MTYNSQLVGETVITFSIDNKLIEIITELITSYNTVSLVIRVICQYSRRYSFPLGFANL